MTEEELSYLKFIWKKKLDSLYEEYFSNKQEVDENDARHHYLSGMIDAYEDILGDL